MKKNHPVELLEESIQMLRSAGSTVLLPYWTGAIPFAVALLLLLHDMAVSWGSRLLLRDSFLCALAFVWLSYWKSRTSGIIFSMLTAEPAVPEPWLNSCTRQAIFQTLKLFVLPFAIASILGWPGASAFFRTLTIDTSFRRAFAAASERYAENLLAFLVMATLTIVAYLNIFVVFLVVPTIWKTLTGYETDWSRMAMADATGLFAVAAIATWLVVDPWIQTYCVLRVFYRNARSDGRDLMRDIGRLAALLLICLLAVPLTCKAADQPQQRLDQSIQHAAAASDYAWLRLNKDPDKNFLTDLAQSLQDSFGRAKNWVTVAWRRLVRTLTGDREQQNPDGKPALAHTQELRWTLGLLALVICAGIVALFFRHRAVNGVSGGPAGMDAARADVLDPAILPGEVRQEEWLRQASEYLSNNETRLAARAFYLANLSYLGAQSLLSLSLSKSNRFYERELARQPRSKALVPPFVAANQLYERSWYGMRELGEEQVEALKYSVTQLRQHA